MRNQLTANIVQLEIGTGVWFPSSIQYDGVAHNGCLLIWDAQKSEHIEYRPCDIGTADYCKATADRFNFYKKN